MNLDGRRGVFQRAARGGVSSLLNPIASLLQLNRDGLSRTLHH